MVLKVCITCIINAGFSYNIFKRYLMNFLLSCIIGNRRASAYSSIAQSVEHAAVNRAVVGSSPTRGVFLYIYLFARPHGQAVKTSPFHGGNRGPNPLGVIYKLIWRRSQAVRHGSATPLSPVRFRSSPLRKNHVYVVLFILVKNKKQGEAIP